MKKLLFIITYAVIVIILFEICAHVAYLIIFGDFYDQTSLLNKIGQYTAPVDSANFGKMNERNLINYQKLQIHPFLGFTNTSLAIDSLGFINREDILTLNQDSEAIVIVITGGSVAKWLDYSGRESDGNSANIFTARLQYALEKRRIHKKFHVYNTAFGGFKQPQQLIALNYLLSLRARIDIVINIDGFNEIVLSYADNARHKIFPFYPRSWKGLIRYYGGSINMERLLEVRSRQQNIHQLYMDMRGNPLAISAGYGIFARLSYQNLNEEMRRISADLENAEAETEYSFDENGPRLDSYGMDEILLKSAEYWARCSELMSMLCKENGIDYYHFLQPNQYVAGSKPFSEGEKKNYIKTSNAYGMVAVPGYPLLQEKYETLREHGVNFFDATDVFANISNTIYRDACCHYTDEGCRILSDFIIEKILEGSGILK